MYGLSVVSATVTTSTATTLVAEPQRKKNGEERSANVNNQKRRIKCHVLVNVLHDHGADCPEDRHNDDEDDADRVGGEGGEPVIEKRQHGSLGLCLHAYF